MKFYSKKSKENLSGFVLLYAILLTGAITTVGVLLVNIITKQLMFSSLNRNSDLTYYYAANAGRECLDYWNRKPVGANHQFRVPFFPGSPNFNAKANPFIKCFGKEIYFLPYDVDPNDPDFVGPSPISAVPGEDHLPDTAKKIIHYKVDPSNNGGSQQIPISVVGELETVVDLDIWVNYCKYNRVSTANCGFVGGSPSFNIYRDNNVVIRATGYDKADATNSRRVTRTATFVR